MQRRMFFVIALLIFALGSSGCAVFRSPAPNAPPEAQTPPERQGPPADPQTADMVIAVTESIEGVESAYAVIISNLAMIGVDFDDNLTTQEQDALKQRVVVEVKARLPGVADVWVTADPDLVARIRGLASRIARGEPISGLFDEITILVERLRPRTDRTPRLP